MSLSSFYINLPSNTIHPSRENKTSCFWVQLPSTLLLKGEWEVALVEANIPVSWYNFPEHPEKNRTIVMLRKEFKFIDKKKHNLFFKTRRAEIKEKTELSFGERKVVKLIPYGNYSSLDSLTSSLNYAFKQIELYPDDEFIRIDREPFIKTEQQNLKPTLNIGRGDLVILPRYLCDILRLRAHPTNPAEIRKSLVHFEGLPLEDKAHYNTLLNTKHISKHYKEYKAEAVPKLQHVSSDIFIYCDIIDNEVLGNTTCPVLRSIRCNEIFGQDMQQIFVSPFYKKVKKSEIQEIQISIRDNQGEFVKFENGNVFLVLHFRPIIK